MPEPREGESRDDFMSRCVPAVLDDGAAESQDQAVAICASIWERRDLPVEYVPLDDAAEFRAQELQRRWDDLSDDPVPDDGWRQ